MKIIPAVDIRCGEFVVFVPNYEIKKKFKNHNPLEIVDYWMSKGAEDIFFTDYDGLFKSSPQNLGVLKDIKKGAKCSVYYSGGVSTPKDLKRTLDAGADFIVINISNFRKSLMNDPLLKANRDKIIVGIDLKDGEYAVEGFNNLINIDAEKKLIELYELGLSQVIVTDITKTEPQNKAFLKGTIKLADEIGYKIIIAGGIASFSDVQFLSSASSKEFEAIIIGRALYMGKIKYKKADELTLLI